VKFFYCNLAICGIAEYKPYDLVVCQREEVNDEYFTISNSGVVHIEPGLGKQTQNEFFNFFFKNLLGFLDNFCDVAKVVIIIQRKILPNLATS